MIKNLTVFTYDAADFMKVVAKKGTEKVGKLQFYLCH